MNSTPRTVIALGLLLACTPTDSTTQAPDDEGARPPAGTEAGDAGTEPGDATTEPEPEPEPEPETVEPRPLAELFSGPTPTLPPALVELGLSFGMSRSAAAAILGGLDDEGRLTIPGFAELPARLRFTDDDDDEVDGTLWELSLELPLDEALALGRAGWGEPSVTEGARPSSWWFAPDQHMRAALIPTRAGAKLQIAPYIPARELLGEGPELAFARDLLGASLDELAARQDQEPELAARLAQLRAELDARRAGRSDRSARYSLGTPLRVWPPTEYSGGATRLSLTVDGRGVVVEYRLVMNFWVMDGDSAGLEALAELLEHKWGPPSVGSDEGDEVYVYSKRPKIVHSYDGHWDLVVSAR